MLVLVAVVAQRLKTPPSILLVIAGIALALIPGLPPVELAPELVLLVLLPPLIYSAGVSMSWREFRFNLRPITLLAFGCVVFTTCAVAAAVHYLLGWQWGVAFVLGAIVAPPDVVAPLAIARRLGLPRRVLVVLEGEGPRQRRHRADPLPLCRAGDRDRRVLADEGRRHLRLDRASARFSIGIGVGWLSLRLRQWAKNPRVEITLSLMTPYLAYWIPEHIGGSGVLATVAAGLYVSWNGPRLIPAATRLQGIFFWDLIIYLIEGFVFLITGLQARTLIEKAHDFPLRELLLAVTVTVAIAIVARFVWMFPATYLSRWLIPAVRQPRSIAAVAAGASWYPLPACAAWCRSPRRLPFHSPSESGAPFPHRDAILFATFGVIIITLVGQGLTLPPVIRWLGIGHHGKAEHRREQEAELAARNEVIHASRRHLEKIASERKLSPEIVEFLNARHDHRERLIPSDLDESLEMMRLSNDVRLELIAAERDFLHELLRDGKITDESRRRLERDLDLEEATILARREGKTPL